MTENKNYRKCFKCRRSQAELNIKLFRFPKPGITNSARCELWAKFCSPDGEWFSPELHQRLYSQHKMLCNRHFKRTSFSDYPESKTKLHRSAVPDEDSDELQVVSVPESKPQPVLQDITNIDINSVSNMKVLPQITQSPQEKTIKKLVFEPQPGPSHITECDVISNVKAQQNLTVVTPSQTLKLVRSYKDKSALAKCRRHMNKICKLKNRIKKLKNKSVLQEISVNKSVQILMDKLTPTFALLLQAQIKNFKKKSKGRRWDIEEKITALRLYKRSPTCYRLMNRLFCLPAPATLKTLLRQFQLDVGINKQIFDVLSNFVKTLNPSDNEYVLMFDEMAIRKNLIYNKKKDLIEGFQDHGNQGRSPQIASYALVFMVAGIRKKVKQPIAYYLSGSSVTADRLAVLIKEILHHCFLAGLSIATTVCDMDRVNRRALRILGATKENPCICVDNINIITMFDPPHLLKCFRNLFLKYDISCITNIKSKDKSGIGVAKWRHIEQFYHLDNGNPNFVFAPALRREHLQPNTKQKMRVKLAAQILSHTVAAGMSAKIAEGQISTDAATTVQVLENMDKLFDALNSDSADLRRGKPFSTNLKSSTPHLQLFEEMKKFFQILKFINCNSTPPSIEGWEWTLSAVKIIWKDMTTSHSNIKSLATRRLQQDPLENLFGCIRGNCGANCNPTASQFVADLKTSIMSNLAHLTTGNCEPDAYEAIINNYKVLLKKNPTDVCTHSTEYLQNLPDSSDMSEEFGFFFDNYDQVESSGEIQACAYVCGFLMNKLHGNMTCEKCKNLFLVAKIDKEHLFTSFKEHGPIKNSLKYCTKDLIQYVERCATEANTLFNKIGHELFFKKSVCNKLKEINNDFLKACPEHFARNLNYFVHSIFYICINRFCRIQNRRFSEEASRIALKKKI